MHLYVDQYTVPMRRVLSCNSRSSAGTEDTRDIQTVERSVELFERPVFLGLQSPKVPKAVWRCLCGASGHCGQPKALAISPGTSSTCCATWALTCPTTPSCLPRSCDWARVSWKRCVLTLELAEIYSLIKSLAVTLNATQVTNNLVKN